jgi:hypothetical protein
VATRDLLPNGCLDQQHRADTSLQLAGDPSHACSLSRRRLIASNLPASLPSNRRSPKRHAFRLGPLDPGVHTFADHL